MKSTIAILAAVLAVALIFIHALMRHDEKLEKRVVFLESLTEQPMPATDPNEITTQGIAKIAAWMKSNRYHKVERDMSLVWAFQAHTNEHLRAVTDWGIAELTVTRQVVAHYTNEVFGHGLPSSQPPQSGTGFYKPVYREAHANILQRNREHIELGLRSDGIVVWRKK